MFVEISIIIPVFQVEKYIEKCLDSIVCDRKGCENIEVILVDDGSTDASGMIADQYAAKYPFICVLHRKNAGVAAARNAGMAVATGQWLYFMDSDDWLAMDALKHLHTAIHHYAHADVILFDAYQEGVAVRPVVWEHFDAEGVWDGKEALAALQRGVLYCHYDFPFSQVPLAAPWDKLYNRQFIERKNLYFVQDLKVLDDMVFNMEVFGEAERAAYYKEKIYHYRYVPQSVTNGYRKDRVAQDCQVWEYIMAYAERKKAYGQWGVTESREFMQAFYCRILKSFAICCRVCFFHQENKDTLFYRISKVRETVMQEPYHTAFRNVHSLRLEWRLWMVWGMERIHFYFGIYLLHLAQERLG